MPRQDTHRAGTLARAACSLVLVVQAASSSACATRYEGVDPVSREPAVVSALVRADRRELAGRPALVEGKYARMARGLYDFYRGTMPIFRADLADPRMRVARTDFDLPGELPFSIGDAHPENFGLLLARDGTLAIEPNDLDAADRYPYQLDLRRLTVGLVLACRIALLSAEDEARVVRATVGRYLQTLASIAQGSYVVGRTTDGSDPIAADLFRRGRRDLAARAELAELTTTESGSRRFRRGPPDADDPENTLSDLPAWAIPPITDTLLEYRSTLVDPPAPEDFAVLDAVREHGSGVASWARIRVLVLIRGPTDEPGDDVILELKEETVSGASGPLPPGVFSDDEADRIRRASRGAWAIPDAEPFFGTAHWLGIPVQIRLESEAQKTFRTERLEGPTASVDALLPWGETLGEILARVQAAPALGAIGATGFPPRLIARVGSDGERFIEGEVEAATAHADVVEVDFEAFRQALRTRGPLLGFESAEPLDGPDLERRALYGTPAEVRPWE